MRRLSALRLVTTLCAALVACGDDDGDEDGAPATSTAEVADFDDVLEIDEIPHALDALDAQLGGPQEYFEVTASPNDVRLYIKVDDEAATAVEPYVYLDGELTSVGDPEPADGHTFTADQVDFDPATVLDGIAERLPTATLRTFSVVGAAPSGVRYGFYVNSSRGGVIDVVVSADGEVLEAGDPTMEVVPATTEPGDTGDPGATDAERGSHGDSDTREGR